MIHAAAPRVENLRFLSGAHTSRLERAIYIYVSTLLHLLFISRRWCYNVDPSAGRGKPARLSEMLIEGSRQIVRTGWRNSLCRLSSSSAHHEISGTIPPGGVGVALGQFAEVERVFTQEDVDKYGRLIDDGNPLHQRWSKSKVPSLVESHPLLVWKEDGSSTMPIAHGMLASGLFSCIFGSLIPGAVYLKQTLDFRKPVYVDSVVTGRVSISRIRHWKRKGLIITCDTKVLSQGKECVRGEADVWIPGGDELSSGLKD